MVAATASALAARRVTDAGGRSPRLAVAMWLAVVVVALAWGTWAVADSGVGLRAAPLYGRWRWHPGWGLVPVAVLAGGVVTFGPGMAARARWRLLPVLTGLAAAGWT
ncbi:MAG: hypothetical protein ACRDZS_14055, partial [Acidimicrobiales bacterium]